MNVSRHVVWLTRTAPKYDVVALRGTMVRICMNRNKCVRWSFVSHVKPRLHVIQLARDRNAVNPSS